MPPHSRFESLPAELLSCILTRCSREDLVNLAQTHSNLCSVCRKELINRPFTMNVTSDNLKSWVAYFGKEDTLLTWGARSLDITIAVRMQDLHKAFNSVNPTVFNVNARPIHPDAIRILPLPSSLRKLSLKMGPMSEPSEPSVILLLLLLRPLPERCPHLEELSIHARPKHPSNEFDICIRRLKHLRKLYLRVWNLPNIPNRLSLLPASLIDLDLDANDIQTHEELTTAVPWVRGIRKIVLLECAPQDIAYALMILSRGGASHLAKLILRSEQYEMEALAVTMLQEALTTGLQEFSLLQPPLRTLSLLHPSAWSNSLHLPLLHTAVASTLVQLSLQGVNSCIFPSHLPWPRLQSLDLVEIPKTGYQGPLNKPIFPVLTTLTICMVEEIQAPEDLFPALETIKWYSYTKTPEQIASLVRHDIKRIDIIAHHTDELFEPLWEAMGGHTIDLIALKGSFPDWMDKLSRNGERIFPGFPNIREFSIEWTS